MLPISEADLTQIVMTRQLKSIAPVDSNVSRTMKLVVAYTVSEPGVKPPSLPCSHWFAFGAQSEQVPNGACHETWPLGHQMSDLIEIQNVEHCHRSSSPDEHGTCGFRVLLVVDQSMQRWLIQVSVGSVVQKYRVAAACQGKARSGLPP